MFSSTRVLHSFFRAAATVGALGLIAIGVLITTDVFVRWITGRPIVGIFEFVGVLLVLVTFLPMGLVLFEERQLRVDIILEQARPRTLGLLGLIDVGVGLIVFGLLLILATEEFQKAYEGRFLLRGMIEIPTWIPVSMVLFGALASVVALLHKLTRCLLTLAGRDDMKPIRSNDIGDL